MFNKILKTFNLWQLLQDATKKNENKPQKDKSLFTSLPKNLEAINNIMSDSNDLVVREFSIGKNSEIKGAVIFIKGLVHKETINEHILKPLMSSDYHLKKDNLITRVHNEIIYVGDLQEIHYMNEVIDKILSGFTIIIFDNYNLALAAGTQGWKQRNVDEPETEAVVRGPREGFTETLRTNTALLRRKIKNPRLTFETFSLGVQTHTDICLVYIKGIANEKVIKEIKKRLAKINTDAILESGYIEEFIEDAPFSPFATIGNSEKPDIVAAKLLEGRTALIIDGTPFVLTIPMVFIESFQAAEDYYSRPYFSSLLRFLRFIAFIISLLGPAVYVALTTFHQELIPTPLLLTMAAAREGTPFPAVVEALGMGVIFEILREAGVRLPRPVGQAVSIVGALVLGDAAVSAGFIGAPMVIVVALTAISSFVVAPQTDSITILRIIMTILAGTLGAFGIVIGLLGILIHLSALRSFGTPYLSPIAPLSVRDLKDVFFRLPVWLMLTRPRTIGWHNINKEEPGMQPKPPEKKY